jgi:hypothetical protein
MSTSTIEQELAPFGWYPDPADSTRLRWWDGFRWTARTEQPRPDLQPAFGYTTSGEIARLHDYI